MRGYRKRHGEHGASRWQSVTPRIVVEDAAGLIEFLRRVFEATGELQTGAPSQVMIGDSRLLVSSAGARESFPAFLYVYVEDADATYRRALDAGATSLEAVWDTPYGDRRGMVRDPWGNVWQIATPVSPRPSTTSTKSGGVARAGRRG